MKAYSNQPSVTLYVDGHELETREGGPVFRFRVPLTGEHSMEARAGDYSSLLGVHHRAQHKLLYRFNHHSHLLKLLQRRVELLDGPLGHRVPRLLQQGSVERSPAAVAGEALSFGTDKIVITGMYRFPYGEAEAVKDFSHRASRGMEPVPSSMLSLFRMGVMHGPDCRVPRSLMCHSFIRLPSASTPGPGW